MIPPLPLHCLAVRGSDEGGVERRPLSKQVALLLAREVFLSVPDSFAIILHGFVLALSPAATEKGTEKGNT